MKRLLYVVVHPASPDSILKAVAVASEAGADGAFLINQGMGEDELRQVRKRLQVPAGFRMGLNLLGSSLADMLLRTYLDQYDMLWSDSPRLRDLIWSRTEAYAGELFGSVAFKGQAPVSDEELPAVAAYAATKVQWVTTSGPCTGRPPRPEKIAALRKVLPPERLALASGVSIENIHTYLPDVGAYLVASSLESEWGVLDPAEVRELAQVIHDYEPLPPSP